MPFSITDLRRARTTSWDTVVGKHEICDTLLKQSLRKKMYNCVSLCQWIGEAEIMDSANCFEGDARKVQKTKEIATGSSVAVGKKAFEGKTDD